MAFCRLSGARSGAAAVSSRIQIGSGYGTGTVLFSEWRPSSGPSSTPPVGSECRRPQQDVAAGRTRQIGFGDGTGVRLVGSLEINRSSCRRASETLAHRSVPPCSDRTRPGEHNAPFGDVHELKPPPASTDRRSVQLAVPSRCPTLRLPRRCTCWSVSPSVYSKRRQLHGCDGTCNTSTPDDLLLPGLRPFIESALQR